MKIMAMSDMAPPSEGGGIPVPCPGVQFGSVGMGDSLSMSNAADSILGMTQGGIDGQLSTIMSKSTPTIGNMNPGSPFGQLSKGGITEANVIGAKGR